MIDKLKFFIKKLALNETKYNELIHKSTCYDNMISCIHINSESESFDAKNGKGNITICRFTRVVNFMVSINIIDMLKAGGFTFDKSVQWNITTTNNNL